MGSLWGHLRRLVQFEALPLSRAMPGRLVLGSTILEREGSEPAPERDRSTYQAGKDLSAAGDRSGVPPSGPG